MASLLIHGGRRLTGSIVAQGSKNSALPILAATFLIGAASSIRHCPALSDVNATLKILRNLGCLVSREGDVLTVDSAPAGGTGISEELMREMRSSVIFLGAILARHGEAEIFTPGGCEIGLRPIDLHLWAMRRLGAEIREEGGKLLCRAPNGLTGAKITFSFPSVGATENAILAAVTAKGETTILNAAREPEISDLCHFLIRAGARIYGAGESVIRIEGVKSLQGAEHSVICDRIAAATYLIAGAVTRGDISVKGTVPAHLGTILPMLEEAGCDVTVRCGEIRLRAPARLSKIDKIVTQPYPGFPTDAQAPMMALTSVAEGTSVIVENIFESRFKHVPELRRMGAKIRAEGRVAVVEGVPYLSGASVICPDLRGGCALALAGLCAEGVTELSDIRHIDRGYENFRENLQMLNADVIRKETEHGEQKND